jgi:hypothetical protein
MGHFPSDSRRIRAWAFESSRIIDERGNQCSMEKVRPKTQCGQYFEQDDAGEEGEGNEGEGREGKSIQFSGVILGAQDTYLETTKVYFVAGLSQRFFWGAARRRAEARVWVGNGKAWPSLCGG